MHTGGVLKSCASDFEQAGCPSQVHDLAADLDWQKNVKVRSNNLADFLQVRIFTDFLPNPLT
jgi:hypothetical protein